LKDLWKKIKAALISLWEKAKALWDKYFSGLGRTKKALESMKERISKSSGKLSQAYIEKAPSSLVTAFPGPTDISSSTIKKFITNHTSADTSVQNVFEL
jgi:hypothetical protein